MAKIVDFYIGKQNNDIANVTDLPFHNGSIFLTTLKEKAEADAFPLGFVYTCNIRSIPRNRRLKEDSEPITTDVSDLMQLSSRYEEVLEKEFAGNPKMAFNIMMQKSRTGAIFESIRQYFYKDLDLEYCQNMVTIGYDGYFGKFYPPANFHTDKQKFHYARIFNLEKIIIKNKEELEPK